VYTCPKALQARGTEAARVAHKSFGHRQKSSKNSLPYANRFCGWHGPRLRVSELGEFSIKSMTPRVFAWSAKCAALTLFAGAGLASTITYDFTMNTSSLLGTSGILDMQFNPGGNGPYDATGVATVSGFQTDGMLVAEDPYTTSFPGGGGELASGNVTGTLTAPVTFTAGPTSLLNEYAQQITFGTELSFQLTLSGQAVSSSICPASPPPGSTCSAPEFFIDFLDSTASTFLFTDDPTGSSPTGWIVGGVQESPNTSTMPFTSPGPGAGPSDLILSGLPEPGTYILLATGLFGLIVLKRRR